MLGWIGVFQQWFGGVRLEVEVRNVVGVRGGVVVDIGKVEGVFPVSRVSLVPDQRSQAGDGPDGVEILGDLPSGANGSEHVALVGETYWRSWSMGGAMSMVGGTLSM